MLMEEGLFDGHTGPLTRGSRQDIDQLVMEHERLADAHPARCVHAKLVECERADVTHAAAIHERHEHLFAMAMFFAIEPLHAGLAEQGGAQRLR